MRVPRPGGHVGFVGVGHQGTGHVRNFLRIPGVEVTAICDLLPEHMERARKLVTDAVHEAGAVKALEDISGTRISAIGVGPDRDQTIVVRDLIAE